MSWLSEKTGRPKEEGGHRRINISVDEPTYSVLKEVGNRSQFIENAIWRCTSSPYITFYESKETMNHDQNTFKSAATFVWIPEDSQSNVVLSTQCYFQYCCSNGDFQFKIVINGIAFDSVRLDSSVNYSLSSVMHFDFCPDGEIKIPPNQSKYEIEFQFAPTSSSGEAYVKDLNLSLIVDDVPICCCRHV